jgi:hypothetical protein
MKQKKVEKSNSINNFKELVNIIISGSAYKAFANLTSHKNTSPLKKVKSSFACVLDFDREEIRNSTGDITYKPEVNLYFKMNVLKNSYQDAI